MLKILTLLLVFLTLLSYVGAAQLAEVETMSLETRLEQAREQKAGSYTVRTQYMSDGLPHYTNRLILEDSPYLLQHAHNPVNWYAWGEEAFAAARAQNKPVFLSIGYSTCHWCHVMEEESFDNQQVAALLNEYFICIKVDREQRPDLDEIYMTAVQLLTGRGGWPMSSFLTPEAKPFYGGTYFPREQFMALLSQVHEAWQTKQSALTDSSAKLHSAMQQQLLARGEAASVGQSQIDQALQQLHGMEDAKFGGFGSAPKFPQESYLLLLLSQVERSDHPLKTNPDWQTLSKVLHAMLQGGIYDQLGGGFHRYATDAQWLVPHFEKMLYNQAQLSRVYARSWALSGEPEFRRIAEETLDYTLREMRSPQGAFYSATDADSEGEEGRFFVWLYSELQQHLIPEQLALVEQVYGVSKGGNFEGSNILHLPNSLLQQSKQLNQSTLSIQQQLNEIKKQLYQVRQQRIPPLRDDKVITEWNGMMITALAEAGRLLQRQDYIDAAVVAAHFLWNNSRVDTKKNSGPLLRIYLNGNTSTQATLEDYSNYLEGLLALYDATRERDWLIKAETVQQQMTELFWDPEGGGFYSSQAQTEGPMIVRSQPAMDGATASGNSVALSALVALNQRDNSLERQQLINEQIVRFSSSINRSPLSLSYMLSGLADHLQQPPGALQYASNGKLRLQANLYRLAPAPNGYQLVLRLSMPDGWHINAHRVEQPDLIATELALKNSESAWRSLSIQYPKPEQLTTAFATKPVAVFRGETEIVMELQRGDDNTPLQSELQVQVCSDDTCLAPETLKLVFQEALE